MIRQEQCDKVCRILDDVLANRPTERDSLIVATRKAFEALEQSEWNLCSKRMPEKHEWIGTKRFGTTISDEVYVTFEAPDGQRFADHISFQNGKLSASDAEKMRVWYKGAKPIAWKPQPEPYKG
jgi:hypothetical protein